MRKRGSERTFKRELLHLVGLCAFTLTEPIYRLIAENPQLLAAHAARRSQLLILLITLSVLAPLCLAAVELLALAFGARARAAVHGVLVFLLVWVFALETAMRLLPSSSGGLPILSLAAVAGAAFVFLYHRSAAVYSFTSFLALLAVVSPVAFLLDSRTREFLRPAPSHPARVAVARPAPLVIVIFDELPLGALLDDRLLIDTGLFPTFARVAGTSHWFRNATTNANYTDLAVPALHSGRYTPPDRLRPATLENYPFNLFTLLGSTYRVQAMESTTNLSPPLEREAGAGASRSDPLLLLADVGAIALHVVMPPPWNARLPRLNVGWAGFWHSDDDADEEGEDGGRSGGPVDRVTELREFLAALEPDALPPFVYIHVLMPHLPWQYLPSGRRYYDSAMMPGLLHGSDWSEDEWLIALAYQRLRVQLQAVDRMLSEILDRLTQLGWLDASLMVVTSDHGTSFAAGAPRRDVGSSDPEILRREIMPIPMFVKLPGQREAVVHDEMAEIIDLLPTLAETLGVEVPWPMDGASLLKPPASTPRRQRRVQLREPFVTVSIDEPASQPLVGLVQRRNQWFGRSPAGATDLFRLGPDADVVGLATVGASPRAPTQRAAIHNENLFRDVEDGQDRVPAFVTGEVVPLTGSPPLASGTPLAIGVDGVVRATTRSYIESTGAVAFAALLPEETLQRGAHQIELFIIDRNGATAALVRIESHGEQEILGQEWKGSSDVLFRADPSTGWKGFTGSMETRLEAAQGGALGISAPGGVPVIELPAFEARDSAGFIVAIETECDAELSPRLSYMTADDPRWRPRRFVQGRLRAGRDTLFLEVEDQDPLGRLSLDLGRTRSRVLLHSLEVRKRGG